MRRLLLAPAVSALLLGTLLATPPAEAGGGITVSGTLVDEKGRPINDLDVFSGFDTVTTNASGHFTVASDMLPDIQLELWDNQYQQFGFDHVLHADTSGGSVDLGTVVLKSFTHPGRSDAAIDTGNKSAVAHAYRRQWKASFRNEKAVTAHGCKVRQTPLAAQRRTIAAVNFARKLSGLDPVALNTTLSAKATKAALIERYLGYLNHFPPAGAKCATKVGRATAGRSNLAVGFEGAGNIAAYMEDFGPNNFEAGHRRWIQDPFTEAMGTGQVGRYEALYVVTSGALRSEDNPVPSTIAWPTAGYFPASLEPGKRWSFGQVRRDVDLSHAKVRVLVGSRVLKLHKFPVLPGYGDQDSLVWDLAKRPKVTAGHTKTFTVRISGILQRGVAMPAYRYKVKLFR
jgi:hypothetical protein